MGKYPIIDKYKIAWEKHDFKLLREIFTEDAIYVEKMNEVSFLGIEEISRYWEKNAAEQSDVEFTPLVVREIDDGKLQCDWTAKFYRRDLKRWLRLDGVMILGLRGNKISHFSERFTKQFLP